MRQFGNFLELKALNDLKKRKKNNISTIAEIKRTQRLEEVPAIGLYMELRQSLSSPNLSPLFSKMNFWLVKQIRSGFMRSF